MGCRFIPIAVLSVALGGCAAGLPSPFSIPRGAPTEVRKSISMFYCDAQWRAHGCVRIQQLDLGGTDCSASIPWLIALLKDDTYAWSPSIFYPHTGTPVWHEAKTALYCIGDPALPALDKAIASSDPKLSKRAKLVSDKIRAPD